MSQALKLYDRTVLLSVLSPLAIIINMFWPFDRCLIAVLGTLSAHSFPNLTMQITPDPDVERVHTQFRL
jgi:hypothetical protein